MTGLWIERTARGRDTVSLRVSGELAGSWVDVLERECSAILAADRRSELELSGLTYMSSAGARLLSGLRRQGLALSGLTPLLREMLDDCDPAVS